MPSRSASLTRRLAYALFVVVAFFALIEGGTRVLWSGPDPEGRMPRDPHLRWGLPDDGTMVLHGVTNRINSLGYRGPEFSEEPSPCTFRIYSAGDSSAYGFGVPDGEAFIELLPGLLRAGGLEDLEVEGINAAVPGYSTYQSLERLEGGDWALSPDLLVISNLWSDAGPAAVADAEFYEDDPGPEDPFPEPPRSPVARLRFVQWATDRLYGAEGTHEEALPPGSVRRVSRAQYAANLGRMIDAAETHGTPPLLLRLPCLDDGEGIGAGNRLLPTDETRFDEQYRDVARQVADERGVLSVDLVPLFRAVDEPLFHDRIHPDARGHALIAQTLARAILEHPELLDRARARCAAASP